MSTPPSKNISPLQEFPGKRGQCFLPFPVIRHPLQDQIIKPWVVGRLQQMIQLMHNYTFDKRLRLRDQVESKNQLSRPDIAASPSAFHRFHCKTCGLYSHPGHPVCQLFPNFFRQNFCRTGCIEFPPIRPGGAQLHPDFFFRKNDALPCRPENLQRNLPSENIMELSGNIFIVLLLRKCIKHPANPVRPASDECFRLGISCPCRHRDRYSSVPPDPDIHIFDSLSDNENLPGKIHNPPPGLAQKKDRRSMPRSPYGPIPPAYIFVLCSRI